LSSGWRRGIVLVNVRNSRHRARIHREAHRSDQPVAGARLISRWRASSWVASAAQLLPASGG
jgi:hypothetical protein